MILYSFWGKYHFFSLKIVIVFYLRQFFPYYARFGLLTGLRQRTMNHLCEKSVYSLLCTQRVHIFLPVVYGNLLICGSNLFFVCLVQLQQRGGGNMTFNGF